MVPVLVATLVAGSVPLQLPVPPVAVQLVASSVTHESAAAWPAWMVAGVTAKATMLAGADVAGVTSTLTDAGPALPPVPVHVSVKVWTPLDMNGPAVTPVLEVGSEPDHPPEALHEEAFCVVHASCVV
jgi:hypothetical protein